MPKLTKPGFGGFGTMPLSLFGNQYQKPPKQLDAVDALDAGTALQGVVVYDWRRPRQLRRLYCEFNPRGRPPFWHDSHNGIFLKNFGKFV